MEKLDYDFSALEAKKHNVGFRFGYLEAAARYTDLGIEVRNYCKEHPACAVVNLGCGLDCTAENVTNIGVDLNDTAWFDAIDDSRGVVFFAAGVFYYFLSSDIQKLFTAMAERFKGGRLCFDAANKKAVKLMLKTWVKAAGITDIDRYFYINNLDTDLKAWLPGTEISAKGYMLGYHDLKTPSVSGFFRFLAKVGDGYMQMRIVQINF